MTYSADRRTVVCGPSTFVAEPTTVTLLDTRHACQHAHQVEIVDPPTTWALAARALDQFVADEGDQVLAGSDPDQSSAALAAADATVTVWCDRRRDTRLTVRPLTDGRIEVGVHHIAGFAAVAVDAATATRLRDAARDLAAGVSVPA